MTTWRGLPICENGGLEDSGTQGSRQVSACLPYSILEDVSFSSKEKKVSSLRQGQRSGGSGGGRGGIRTFGGFVLARDPLRTVTMFLLHWVSSQKSL